MSSLKNRDEVLVKYTVDPVAHIIDQVTEDTKIVYLVEEDTNIWEEFIYKELKKRQLSFNRDLVDRTFSFGEFGKLSVVLYKQPLDLRLIVKGLNPDLLIIDDTLWGEYKNFKVYLEESDCRVYVLSIVDTIGGN